MDEHRENQIKAYKMFSTPADGERDQSTAIYLRGMMDAEIDLLPPTVKTGFSRLDKITGGLPIGLTILMAPSSTGKTTLALQLADQIATSGRDVIFFSLEQSTLDLMSKSLSRYISRQNDAPPLTAYKIKYTKPQDRTPEEQAAIDKAIAEYTEDTGGRLCIVECDLKYTYQDICDFLLDADVGYMTRTKTKPLVIIDYLQLLYTPEKTQTRRDQIDEVTIALRILARNQHIPILCLASVNSESRLQPLAADSAKESTDTGYRADLTLGLQYSIMDDNTRLEMEYGNYTTQAGKNGSIINPFLNPQQGNKPIRDAIIKAEKEHQTREITLVSLKNRDAADGLTRFKYRTDRDRFDEILTPAQRMEEKRIKNAAEEAKIDAWLYEQARGN
ncbi:MAG: hypothetical protein IIY54_00110 [Ruminococcus sp.]|nr:hypothetical protein [Ruminococcus sp.]